MMSERTETVLNRATMKMYAWGFFLFPFILSLPTPILLSPQVSIFGNKKRLHTIT